MATINVNVSSKREASDMEKGIKAGGVINVCDGYYTKKFTSDTIAVINGIGHRVAYIKNRVTGLSDRIITNERVIFISHIANKDEFNFEPFKNNK